MPGTTRALALTVLLFTLAVGVACADLTEDQQEQETRQEQAQQQDERTRVIERTVVRTVEAPERTVEQPAEPETPEVPAPEETLALQYQYINEGNYEAAYELFSERSKQLVSPEQYRTYFENAGYYEIIEYAFSSVQVEGDTAAVVTDLFVSSGTDGDQQYQRAQQMVLEDGAWRVVMRDEQVSIFTGAGTEQPSDAQLPEDANVKQVTVEISSDVPADVSIYDDNFDVGIVEEITGTETYEFEVAADSGLSVSAMSEEMMNGNISIAVYENGQLVSQDTSSEGYAQVTY
jgi:hypothetical protein